MLSTVRYAYLGPEGTFTEAAARCLPDADGALVPLPSVPEALEAVRYGKVDGAVVPLENSVEGSVNATLDELIRGEPLTIAREVLLPVEFALLARPGTNLTSIARVVTHPVAEAQCRQWLASHLPHARVYLTASTAAAAAMVANAPTGRSPSGAGVSVAEPTGAEPTGAEPTGAEPTDAGATPVAPRGAVPIDETYDAAVAAAVAADHYRLDVLAAGIGDNPDAMTRFVLVTTPRTPPPPTAADRTSLVAFIRDDHPGALLEILEQFATRGVNLTRIESRPTGSGLGKYCFTVDCEGHVTDARVGEALMGLRRVCADVRFLGSYPRADRTITAVGHGMSNADFEDASRWLDGLR